MRVRLDLFREEFPKTNSKRNKSARSGANRTCVISPQIWQARDRAAHPIILFLLQTPKHATHVLAATTQRITADGFFFFGDHEE